MSELSKLSPDNSRVVLSTAQRTIDSNLWKHTAYAIESGIEQLHRHLDHPAVQATLKAWRWDNPYHQLAQKVRAAAAQIKTSRLIGAFDKIIGTLRQLVQLIEKWAPEAVGDQAAAAVKGDAPR